MNNNKIVVKANRQKNDKIKKYMTIKKIAENYIKHMRINRPNETDTS